MWNQLQRPVSVLGGRETLGSSEGTPGPGLAEARTLGTEGAARKGFLGKKKYIGAKRNIAKRIGVSLAREKRS